MASEREEDLWGFLVPVCAIHRGDLFQLPFSETGQGVPSVRAKLVRAVKQPSH